jgi:hypothetical protein
MSFRVYVKLPTSEPFLQQLPPDQADWDRWFAAWDALSLYDEPLGGDHTVYHFWSGIAHEIGLSLITTIYQNGLEISNSEELAEFEHELDRLEEYWNTHELRDTAPKSAVAGHLREHLQERMGYCRTAIQVAREQGGVLGIS